jgi:hypothetical protein
LLFLAPRAVDQLVCAIVRRCWIKMAFFVASACRVSIVQSIKCFCKLLFLCLLCNTLVVDRLLCHTQLCLFWCVTKHCSKGKAKFSKRDWCLTCNCSPEKHAFIYQAEGGERARGAASGQTSGGSSGGSSKARSKDTNNNNSGSGGGGGGEVKRGQASGGHFTLGGRLASRVASSATTSSAATKAKRKSNSDSTSTIDGGGVKQRARVQRQRKPTGGGGGAKRSDASRESERRASSSGGGGGGGRRRSISPRATRTAPSTDTSHRSTATPAPPDDASSRAFKRVSRPLPAAADLGYHEQRQEYIHLDVASAGMIVVSSFRFAMICNHLHGVFFLYIYRLTAWRLLSNTHDRSRRRHIAKRNDNATKCIHRHQSVDQHHRRHPT